MHGILPKTYESCQFHCQMTYNVLQMMLPNSAKVYTIYFNNGPNPNCVTQIYLGKIQNLKVGGPGPPEKNSGGPRLMRPPGSATYGCG